MRPRLHDGPRLDLGGHLFPFLAVEFQSLQKGVVFVFGPPARVFLAGFHDAAGCVGIEG